MLPSFFPLQLTTGEKEVVVGVEGRRCLAWLLFRLLFLFAI